MRLEIEARLDHGRRPSPAPLDKPQLLYCTSSVSGRCRRVDGFLAQVLQRRRNHRTFRLYRITKEDRPDLVERFAAGVLPTLVVVERKLVRGKLAAPTTCGEIEAFLSPWLN